MSKAISFTLVFILSSVAIVIPRAQQTAAQESNREQLTNKDVLEMMRSGLAVEIIIAKVRSTPSKFDTTPAALADLKAAGVHDAVIVAMVEGPGKPPGNSGPPVDVKVPDGTELEIQLKNTLTGEHAKAGDIVDFTVSRDVKINGVTIIERDASARAKLTMAKKSGRWGRAGKLQWAMQDVQAVDGRRIPARFTKREVGDSKAGTVAIAALASTILVGPLSLFWGLKKGRAAIIPAGNRYTVFIEGDTTIKAATNLSFN